MEESKQKLILVVKVMLFILFMAMVIVGQKTTGHLYLFIQLIGLTGLLVLLWNYNRKYL